MWFDALVFVLFFVPALLFLRLNPWVPSVCDRILLIVGGTIEILCVVLITVAVLNAPLGDVVTIWSTCIVWVPVVECAIAPYTKGDKRRCPSNLPLQVLFICLAIGGVVIITRPTFLFGVGAGDEETREKEAQGYRKDGERKNGNNSIFFYSL
jgi:drug/metabolite transporter (DMT)-like permease